MSEALDGYTFTQTLCEDDEFRLQRALRAADRAPVLVLTPARPDAATAARLAQAFALRTQFDPPWMARPLALVGSALVLSDPGASFLPLSLLADLRHYTSGAGPASGQPDGPVRVQTPAALVGRSAELAELEQAAARVAAGGAPEMLVLSGPAGSGKSALMASLLQSDTLVGAMVVAGKFDQYQRNTPYGTLARALQKLVRQLRSQSASALAHWQHEIGAALGPNARLMIDLIPDLRFVIGEHEAPPELPPLEAQSRFQSVFRQFLGALSGADSLLVLCLDDLQWIDPASLKLLTHLVTHQRVHHLLVLGAYRSGEVDSAHPLAQALDAMASQGAQLRALPMAPLDREAIAELIAAALDGTVAQTQRLAGPVYAKAGGNPFFTLQFLGRLAEHGLLRFDARIGAWLWDEEAVDARDFSDNVIDLMIGRFGQLPVPTLEMVKLLACLGHDADQSTLARVAGLGQAQLEERLWPALRMGLLKHDAKGYHFLHDRVHEAAYKLNLAGQLPAQHLRIARQLLAAQSPETLGESLFAIVGHFNRGRAAITDESELRQLARFNAQAGSKARAAIAYDAARHHLDLAAALTPPQAWQDDFDATFALIIALAECEYLCGHFERADALFGELAGQARERRETARVASLRIALYQMSGRFELAVDAALDALAQFGVTFPEAPADIAQALAHERAAADRNMNGRSIAELFDAPPNTDPEIALVSTLMAEMGSSVFSARPALYGLLAVKALNLALRFGTTGTSCQTYSRYAIMLVSEGAVADAFAFSELALELAQHGEPPSERLGRLLFVHGAYIHSWRMPMADSVPVLERAFAACQEAGDLPHAGYAAHIATWNLFETGAPLSQVRERATAYQAFARRQHNEVMMQLLRCYEQLATCLQGETREEGSFDDERFSSAGAFAMFGKSGFGSAKARYHLMRQVAAFTFCQYDRALEAGDAAAQDQHFFLASLAEASHHFFYALAMAAVLDDVVPERQARYLGAIMLVQEKLRLWADNCPANFEARRLLLNAEVARIESRDNDAMHLYDQAIAAARSHAQVHNEALACELTARFYTARRFERIALAYARDAALAYRRWGAHGKVRQMERRMPGLLRDTGAGIDSRAGPASAALETLEAIRAAQAVVAACGSAVLGATLLRTAIDACGAERAVLVQGGRITVQADAHAGGVQINETALPMQASLVPETVLAHVLRSGEKVLVDDLRGQARFRADPYLAAAGPCAMLCLPLGRQGALYLESRQSAGLFTPVRVALLDLLVAQAALALDGAAQHSQGKVA